MPFVVSVFCANSKPNNAEQFFEDVTNELSEGLVNGITDSYHTDVDLSCFICDTPARSFVKQTKGHAGYFGCDFCTQKGVYRGTRMTFPSLTSPPRTDFAFRNHKQDGHHEGWSPLQELGIDMIACFPPDYMHCVCCGFVRRFLKLLRSVPPSHVAYLSL